jgi:hypothetical protein
VATYSWSRGGGSQGLWLSCVLPVGVSTDCGVTGERTHYAAPWTLAKSSVYKLGIRSGNTSWITIGEMGGRHTIYRTRDYILWRLSPRLAVRFDSIQTPTSMLCMLYLLLINATYMACLYTRTLHCNYSNASGNTICSKLSAHLVVQLSMLVSYNIYSSLNLLQLTGAPGSHSPYPETQRQASGSDLVGLD